MYTTYNTYWCCSEIEARTADHLPANLATRASYDLVFFG